MIAVAIVAGCLLGYLAAVIAATHPRRDVIAPVSRRAMRDLLERHSPSDPDGTP